MGFKFKGKKIWLPSLKATNSVIQGSDEFKSKAIAKGLLLQIVPSDLTAIPIHREPSMQNLLDEFASVFEEPQALPAEKGHEHQINLKEGVPPHYQRPYRYPYYQKTEIEKIVKDLLDSWGLNKEIVKDKFLIPVIDELLDELQGAMVFSKLDLRKFIKGYGQIAFPLTALLKNDAFEWSDKAEKAFEELKAAVSQPPVLALPDFTQSFVVECDASEFGIGVVLMQGGRPLAFFSQASKE
uniref:Reverse transcriptase/retrotransposon-derived protein RNase H-like domain-containing protein n=1 Tax=Fagus sylvatica TaxID=28930 RepID=A0A2N9I1P8_FAGSY